MFVISSGDTWRYRFIRLFSESSSFLDSLIFNMSAYIRALGMVSGAVTVFIFFK